MLEVLKVDILLLRKKPLESVGHNALASLTYFITFLAFLFQSLTGFGMYAAMSDSWFPKLFSWIVPVLGGDLAARNVHHILMALLSKEPISALTGSERNDVIVCA